MERPRHKILLLMSLILMATLAGLYLNGLAPIGRLALVLGQPRIAISLLKDPYWRGMALYRLGLFEEAAKTFRHAGKAGFYNRANALARTGRYPEAVALYDAVLFYDPDDESALANRALVNALIDHKTGTPSLGRIAAEEGKQREKPRSPENNPIPNDYSWADAIRYSSFFRSDKTVAASKAWLEALTDDPGRYLQLRIAAEHERRRQAGTAAPPGEDQW